MNKNAPPVRVWYAYEPSHGHLDGPAYLGITKRQMQRLVASRKIGSTRLGLHTLFSQEQLDDYIAACTIPPRPS